jgi:glycosyltransferase involved in cell wall biosynthesis
MSINSITFVAPHQLRQSGGIHVIEQFARRLGARAEVNLVVLNRRALVPIPNVNVTHRGRQMGRRFPSADVLVLPGDSAAGDSLARLPDRVGRRVLLVQSLNHPNGELTQRNLLLVADRVAVSPWLVDQTSSAETRTVLVRPGIDRRTFFPPRRRGDAPRGRRVSMLLHHAENKGAADGLAALRMVRHAVPEVDIQFFGSGDAPVPPLGMHHGRLSRSGVGALLRRSAVFACSSWQEGLGLPNLEALLCGAALATTDTGGGRDFAIDRTTALVSPPHAPEALAANIVQLLKDDALRDGLASAGGELARSRYPTWQAAAERFHGALAAF